MPNILRAKSCLGICLFLFLTFSTDILYSQVCPGLPPILGSGSNKSSDKLCSPVNGSIDYNITFSSPTHPANVVLEINWDDGFVESIPLIQTFVGLNAALRVDDYPHSYPINSDCEYNVVMTLVQNGVRCAATRQVQKIRSFRTDEFNGGNVQLISPTTGTRVHEVCRGVDILVQFLDDTQFNCNQTYVHAPGPLPIESPNIEQRWQQIIYNTPMAGAKIPNVSVNGVPVTGAGGTDVISNYDDPRGVLLMPFPVTNATAKRSTLPITAPGGFGAGFPVVGDEFEITIRYWNACNPYDDPFDAGPNPDNPPVERTAIIRIVAAPAAPTASTQAPVCYGTTPSAFSITGVPANNIVSWYRNVAGAPDTQGTLITSGVGMTSLPVTSHPNWVNNSTPGIYKVWASYRPNVVGALNCESPAVQVVRTIRERPAVPTPTVPPPAEICNGGSFTITMPAPATETVGGATQYTWTGSSGISIGGTTANTGTFNVNVTFAIGETFVDRTVTVGRRFTSTPSCSRSTPFNIRVYRPTVAGTPSATPDVCETTPVGTIALSGHVGDILKWEVSKDGGLFADYTGAASGNSISPGILSFGVYRFRAVVQNGPCNVLTSPEELVNVSQNPGLPANAGLDQFHCGPLTSDPFGASDPTPGTGTWTYIAALSNVPNPLIPPTISNVNDRNATITVAAANAGTYVMRWTVTSGLCSSSDDVVIDFGAPVDPADAGLDKRSCGVDFTLEAIPPSVGIGEWTILSGPGGCSGAGCPLTIANTGIATSTISLDGPAFLYGAYTLRWTVRSGGLGCFFDEDEVQITFDEPMTILTAPDVYAGCVDPTTLTPINVSGTFSGGSGGGNGHWEVVSGNGTFTSNGAAIGGDLASPSDDSYTPTLADYNANDPIELKYVVTKPAGSNCPNAEEQVFVTFDPKPTANAGTNVTDICGSETALDAQSPAPFTSTGIWSSPDATLQFFSSVDQVTPDNTDPKAIVKNLKLGLNTVTWTLTYTNPITFATCVSDPVSITVERETLPTPTPIDVYDCEISPAGGPVVTNILLTDYDDDISAAVVALPATITWFKDGPPPLGTSVSNPSTVQSNVVDGQVYSGRIRDNNGCITDAALTVHVRPLAPAIDASAALCEDSPGSGTVSNINLSTAFFIDKVTGGAAGVEVHWFQTLFDAQTNDPLTEITAPFDIAGNAQVVARITYSTPTASAPACPDFAELDLILNTIPAGAAINGPQEVCMGENGANIDDLPIYTYQIGSIPGATYIWSVPQGAGEFVLFGGGGVNDFFVILKFPFTANPPPLNISVSIVLSSCTSAPIPLPITREEIPSGPDVFGKADVCQDTKGEPYSIVTPSGNSYIWTITKQSDGTQGGAFIVGGQGFDEIFVDFTNEPVVITVREQNSVCASPDVPFPVAVNLVPDMQAPSPFICSDSPIGVVFAPSALSVPIDHYDILSFSTSGLTYVVPGPPTGPVAQNNVGPNAIQGHTFENLSPTPVTANYAVQPVAVNGNGLDCPGPAKIIVVTIHPEPQLELGLIKDVCSGEMANLLLLSKANSFPADGFIINSLNIPAGVTPVDPNIPLLADGVTPHPATILQTHSFINTTNTFQEVEYFISPRNSTLQPSGCTGNPPTPVIIKVFPRTIVDQIITSTPICNGELIDVTFGATGNTDAKFEWQVKSLDNFLTLNTDASSGGNRVLAITDMNVTNQSQANIGTVEIGVRAINDAPGEGAHCLNPEVVFEVDIRPSPVATNQLGVNACSDAPGGNFYTADLTTLEQFISPDFADPNVDIRWWDGDPSDPSTLEITAPALNSIQMESIDIVFVTVTNSITSCTKVVQASYDVKPNIGFNVTSTDVKCSSESNGLVDVLVTSGNPQYLYSIRKLADPYGAPVSSGLTNFQFKFLEGDVDYMVKVESQSNPGCLMEKPIRVEQPDPLVVTIPTNPVLQEISCFGRADGIIDAGATGGTPPYQFILSNNGEDNTDGVFDQLSAGTYLVFVKDKNGGPDACQNSASVTIEAPDPVEIRSMIAPVNALGFQLGCSNALDGQINFELETVGGLGNNQTGTEDFVYTLTRNNNPFDVQQTTATLGTFPNLGPGNYQLVATDENDCASTPKFVVIVAPPPFDPGVVGNNMSVCDGVKPADLFQVAPPFGGLGNFDFEWQVSLDGTNFSPADPVGNNDKNPSFVFDAAGLVYDPSNPKFYYRRQVITAPGVSSCAPDFSNVVEVTVNPSPIAIADAISLLCEDYASGTATLTLAQGTYPVRYTYEISGFGKFFNNLGGDPSTLDPATVFIPGSATKNGDFTVTFTEITDAKGCRAPDPAPANVSVIPLSAVFTLSDNDICSGEPITVSFARDNDLDYTLTFGDGSEVKYDHGEGDFNPQEEVKVYVNNNTSTPNKFQVRLVADYTILDGCDVDEDEDVIVQPTALVNLLPGETELCSGEFFEVRDRSLGVTSGQWMFAKGTDPPIPVPGGDPVPGDLSEQMFNPSVAPGDNPTAYTFTYVPEGGTNCPVAPVSIPVNVYAMPTALFSASDAAPDFVGGAAEVTFKNESMPFDPSGVIQYVWEYGETGVTADPGATPAERIVRYKTKSDKTVVLTVTNASNDRCETRFEMLIDVEVPGLAAAFTVTPRFACVPVTIKTENLSAGADRFEWDLITPNNSVETTTITEPEWTLTTPGVYTIRHRAGVIGDATTVEAPPIVVEVYESPFAQFEIFLNQTVYIGTEVRVTNKTLGADTFSWNFGDHPESENKIDFQPAYAYASEGNYDITLTAFKDYGPKDQDGDGVADGNVVCLDKAVRPITVRPGGSLKIPNAFTPNESNSEGGGPNDGTHNDVFMPIMDGVEEFTMQIFDRWGTLIFESREKSNGWNGYDRNGRIMPAGVYVYKIVLRLTDDSRTTKIGDVTLIR